MILVCFDVKDVKTRSFLQILLLLTLRMILLSTEVLVTVMTGISK